MGMRKGQKHYTEEFKQEILRKIREGEIGVKECTRIYGVSNYALRCWRKEGYRPKKELTELEKLQKENEYLRMENKVLKSFRQAVTREEQKRNFK